MTAKISKIEWLLRIGVCGIFLGHGMYAFQVNLQWIPYLTFWGFSAEQAQGLMPVIGVIDIGIAVISLLRPWPPLLLYAAFWAFMAALMRPFTGTEIWAFVERAGNWVVPLCLYFLIRHSRPKKD